MGSNKSIDETWQDCEVAGRRCQMAIDPDGEPVGRFVRRRVEQQHPDAGVTAPGWEGWVVDWFWPVVVLSGSGLVLFLCLAMALL